MKFISPLPLPSPFTSAVQLLVLLFIMNWSKVNLSVGAGAAEETNSTMVDQLDTTNASDPETMDCLKTIKKTRKTGNSNLKCTQCDPTQGDCDGSEQCSGNSHAYSCFTFHGKINEESGYVEKGCWENSEICAMKKVRNLNGCTKFSETFEKSVYNGDFCFCGEDKCDFKKETGRKLRNDKNQASTGRIYISISIILLTLSVSGIPFYLGLELTT